MPVSKHTRNGKVRKHVLRTSGACVNGQHTGPAKLTKAQYLRQKLFGGR